MNFTENMNEILKQEAELVFESFTMEEAYALGTLLYTKARLSRDAQRHVDYTASSCS